MHQVPTLQIPILPVTAMGDTAERSAKIYPIALWFVLLSKWVHGSSIYAWL